LRVSHTTAASLDGGPVGDGGPVADGAGCGECRPTIGTSASWAGIPGLAAVAHFFGPHEERYTGLGEPLVGASWLNRPLSAGWLMGVLSGDTAIEGSVDQGANFFGGYRLGWDCDHYYGGEMRLAFAALDVSDVPTGNDLGTDDVLLWDISVLYYPWGDSRWRPYLSAGLGLAHFDVEDAQGQRFKEDLVGIPLGGGLKYRCSPWFALRLDLTDNIAVSNRSLSTMHNFSCTLSTELHFGGTRLSFWPWNPSP
jgi:hypothetical protein